MKRIDHMSLERGTMMKPLVTIGVCVRNSEDFVGEAIESISHQDFPHELVEIVFVDDGSTDKTLAVIEESVSGIDMYAKIIHSSWKGLGHARNTVVANANGEYILWVDGDMTLSRDFVRKLVEFMKAHHEIGIAKGRQALKPGSNLLSTLETYSRAVGRMVDYQSEKGRFKSLGTGGSIYRRKLIDQVGGFDESLKGYNEDWDLEIRARKAGWSLSTVDALFLDYERRGLTWKNLWSRYWLRGYFTHFFLHKNRGMLKHYRMFPPAAFVSGILQSFTLFRLTKQRTVFLLPFQSAFKMMAWYTGYLRSHSDAYHPTHL